MQEAKLCLSEFNMTHPIGFIYHIFFSLFASAEPVYSQISLYMNVD